MDTKQIECLDRSNAIISANKLASSVSKQISNEMERANESEGAMKRWKNREVRSISKSKSDRWLVSVLTRFARPANQPINLKGIFLWNWDIDLSISPEVEEVWAGILIPVHSIISLFRLSIENGRLATFLVELIS